MSTYKRNRDTVASSIYTTEQKPSIEQWLEDTAKNIQEPVTALGLTMPEKCLGSLEQRPGMDKGLLERDLGTRYEIEDRIIAFKERARRQDESFKKSELQEDILQENINSVQQQLGMQDPFLKDRLTLHERRLELADQQINTQQELIKHLLEGQASISRQLGLITQQLSLLFGQYAQQPQVEEPEGQQSNPGGVNKGTDASDYVLVSEDEATTT